MGVAILDNTGFNLCVWFSHQLNYPSFISNNFDSILILRQTLGYLVFAIINWYFSNFIFNPFFLSWLNTACRCWRCPHVVQGNTSMSFKYNMRNSSILPITINIRCWKIPGSLTKLKGITLNWKSPEWHANAVFSDQPDRVLLTSIPTSNQGWKNRRLYREEPVCCLLMIVGTEDAKRCY